MKSFPILLLLVVALVLLLSPTDALFGKKKEKDPAKRDGKEMFNLGSELLSSTCKLTGIDYNTAP